MKVFSDELESWWSHRYSTPELRVDDHGEDQLDGRRYFAYLVGREHYCGVGGSRESAILCLLQTLRYQREFYAHTKDDELTEDIKEDKRFVEFMYWHNDNVNVVEADLLDTLSD